MDDHFDLLQLALMELKHQFSSCSTIENILIYYETNQHHKDSDEESNVRE